MTDRTYKIFEILYRKDLLGLNSFYPPIIYGAESIGEVGFVNDIELLFNEDNVKIFKLKDHITMYATGLSDEELHDLIQAQQLVFYNNWDFIWFPIKKVLIDI